jgi:uncharacterized membrane protein
MLKDDQNRPTNTDPRRIQTTGGMMVGALAVLALLALVWMWSPWSSNHTADNSRPGTTVGSSTTRAPTAPSTAPAPAAPNAPSSAR